MFGAVRKGAAPPIGSEMTLHYTPAALPFRMMGGVWDAADGRIAEIASYPRMAAAIGQAYRLGSDTYNTETHFRFPPSDRFRKGAIFTTTPASGIAAISGAPVIAENTITFSGGLDVAGLPGSSGLEFFGINIDTPPATGKTIFLYIGDTNSFPPGTYNQIAIKSTGWEIYNLAGTPSAVSGRAAAALNDDVIMYRNSMTGAWGIIYPDGTDSGDLSSSYGGFTGTGYVGIYMDQAGTITINSDTTGLTPPLGYSAMATTRQASTASTIGTRGGSANSAGHALTLAQLPAVDLPLHINGATAGDIGTGNIDRRTAPGSTGTEIMDGTNFARLAGGGGSHAHAIDPEYIEVLRVVRVA